MEYELYLLLQTTSSPNMSQVKRHTLSCEHLTARSPWQHHLIWLESKLGSI